MRTEVQPKTIAGLGEVAHRYDAYFVDQFGVLHDGTRPYPHAIAALRKLAEAGKRVVLLSNSGKRSAPNAARLESLGFERNLWTQILTSGEIGWAILAEASARDSARRRCLLIARNGDRSAIDGLPITVTASAADCDFVLIAGSEGDTTSLDAYRALLAPAVARGVPAYCTNPDTQMLTPQGLCFGAGRIAALYERLGGTIISIGKPHSAIYAAARRVIEDVPAARILCIGDSLDHDIAGAQSADLDSCLISGGVHADVAPDELPALFGKTGAAPDFILPEMRW